MTNSEAHLTIKSTEEEAEKEIVWLKDKIALLRDRPEGKRRNGKGNIGEEFCKRMLLISARTLEVSDRILINNSKIPYDHPPKNAKGEIRLSEVNESRKDRKKSGEDVRGVSGTGQDLFVYLFMPEIDDHVLIAVIEAKTYCDSSMFKRFKVESESLAMISTAQIKFIVFQMENALGGDIESTAVCSDTNRMGYGARSFSLNRRRLLGERAPDFDMLTVRGAKRNSDKEICEYTPFDKERIREIIEFFVCFLKNKIEKNV